MEKECEICGMFFTVTRKGQKYCPDCRINSDKKKKQMERNIKASIKKYGTGAPVTLYTGTCQYCGKVFQKPYEADFCSAECSAKYRTQYDIEHLTCTVCGKNLFSLGIVDNPRKKTHFCSPECEREYRKSIGEIFNCKYCGKEVIRKGGGTYCSRQCAVMGSRGPREREQRQEICPVCKKIFWSDSPGTCSEKCRSIQLEREKIEKLEREKIEENKKAKSENQFLRENGLCPTCRRPYKDCERMTSNFKSVPEGAVVVGSIVIKCPKYFRIRL